MRHPLHPSRVRALLAAGVVATTLAAAPAASEAASASYAGGTITYAVAPGETNHVAVTPWGLGLTLTDTGTHGWNASPNVVTAGTGCWQFGSTSAICPGTATTISGDLGDGNDSFDAHLASAAVHVKGGAGDDSLVGGSAADQLDGGAGNDSFEARDAAIDTILCGDGIDTGNADAADSVSTDCESVLKTAPAPVAPEPITDPIVDPGTAPPASTIDPGNSGDPGTATTPNAVPTSIPPQTVGVSASGVASVRIVCPPESGGCRGTVVIDIPQASSPKRHHRLSAIASTARRTPPLRIGKAKFRAKAGTSPVIPVRLSKRGRQRILRGHRSRARITVTSRSAAGRTVVTSQEVTIRPRTAARRSGRRTRP